MRCLSAVLALLLATLFGLPSAGFADGVLAIVHLPDWGSSPSAAPTQDAGSAAATGSSEPGSRPENSDLYARAQLNGEDATPSSANGLPLAITMPSSENEPPLAITSFPTSE